MIREVSVERKDVMPAQRTLRSRRVSGRGRGEAEKEAQQLAALTKFLPDLHTQVRTALVEDTADLSAAFGNPDSILAEVEGLSVEDRNKLRVAITKGTDHPAPSDAQVAEEEAHAKTQLVVTWFDRILFAWKLWGREQRQLRLDHFFLPDQEHCVEAAKQDWRDYFATSKEFLFSTVALNPSGFEFATTEWGANIRRALVHGPVLLPRSLAIRTNHGCEFVVSV